MTVEDRLRGALAATVDYQPSPDLFAKVRGSIEDDRAHRRRVLRISSAVAGFAAAVALWLAAWWDPQPALAPLPWWVVVVAVVAIEAAVVVALRPSIRRFGKIYAEDVFRTNPATGPRFLALLDVAYYLVFVGYILATLRLRPDHIWRFGSGFPELLTGAFGVIGGLLLLIGVLHALTIFALPFTGLVFASIRHRLLVRRTRVQWPPEVRRAHRTATMVLVVAAGLLAIGFLWLVLAMIGVVAAGLGGS